MAGFPFALGCLGRLFFFVAVQAFLAVCGHAKIVPRVCSTFGGGAHAILRACQLRFRCALQCVLLAVIGLCWTRCNAGWRAVLDVSDKV